MKKSLQVFLGAVSVSALAVAAGDSALAGGEVVVPMQPAPERILSGKVALYGAHMFGWHGFDEATPGKSAFSLGGSGDMDIPFGDNFSLQLGFQGEGALVGDADSSEEYNSGVLTSAHAIYRASDLYMFGVFGGIGKVSNASSSSGVAT